ncbi:hypothetical protein OCU04_010039 [Sclerotinia nivalis]|uniref:Uncharacterized protein n=1 Tax=Sclerotinia nivalis TaxID=352851 RepID=A0A9X0DFW3_9HELO|nr:hypothetical protein OCU04_010039 [Sclerotinia nivalis]
MFHSAAQNFSTTIPKLSPEKLYPDPPTTPNMGLSTPESSPTTTGLWSTPESSPPPMNLSSTPDSSPLHQAYTHCTISNPTTFSNWLDSIGPQNINTITHLTLLPSQHLGRITSLSTLGDTLGDSLGDTTTYTELHNWITLLQRLSNTCPSIRSLTIFFAADMSGRDTHGYRRGAGECLGFIWAIGRFRGLEWVDLRGYFPGQWVWYLRSLWGDGVRVFNGVGVEEWGLREWRRGTERLDPREFRW